MKYQTLLEESSPRLAELEARLGQAKRKPEPAIKRGTRLSADGRKRGSWLSLEPDEFENWFWSMAFKNDTNGCWEWMGSLDKKGYPAFTQWRKQWKGHRYSAMLIMGKMPNLLVCHKCDNPKCITLLTYLLEPIKTTLKT